MQKYIYYKKKFIIILNEYCQQYITVKVHVYNTRERVGF